MDIGCGIRPQAFFQPTVHLCCEPYHEYTKALIQHFADVPGLVVLQNTGQSILDQTPDKSVDSIFLIDVIEHMEKDDGLRLLESCERVVRQQIVLFTPLGFMPQEYGAHDEDAWGFSGGEWQKHRSGWELNDFDNTWDLLVCKEYHLTDSRGERLTNPFGAIWAIKDNQ